MTTPPSHAEIAELLGAYALDAVDDGERHLVEDHLAGCPRCRAEVAEHREVAAQLAFGGAAAPEGVWARIAAELEPAMPEPELGRLYPMRRAPRSPAMPALAAVAAALTLVVAGLGWEVHTQQRRIDRVSAAVGPAGLRDLMAIAEANPRSARYVLSSAGGAIRVTAVIGPDGAGYLASNGTLAPLPAGRTYQLWGLKGTAAVSLGILGARPGIVAFSASVSDAPALAITAEQAGGAAQPSQAPLAVGDLTS